MITIYRFLYNYIITNIYYMMFMNNYFKLFLINFNMTKF